MTRRSISLQVPWTGCHSEDPVFCESAGAFPQAVNSDIIGRVSIGLQQLLYVFVAFFSAVQGLRETGQLLFWRRQTMRPFGTLKNGRRKR